MSASWMGACQHAPAGPVAKLVPRARRWYLVCWDLDRRDWRTLRVDRISTVRATGVRATPRTLPIVDAAEFVERRFVTGEPVHEARVLLHAPVDVARAYLGAYASGLQPASDRTSFWLLQDAHLESLAARLVWIPWGFEVLEPAALRDLVQRVGRRFQESATD